MEDLLSVVVLDNSYPKVSLDCNNNRCCNNKGWVLFFVVFCCAGFFLIKQTINSTYSDLRSGSSCLFCTIFLFVPVILDFAVLIKIVWDSFILFQFESSAEMLFSILWKLTFKWLMNKLPVPGFNNISETTLLSSDASLKIETKQHLAFISSKEHYIYLLLYSWSCLACPYGNTEEAATK